MATVPASRISPQPDEEADMSVERAAAHADELLGVLADRLRNLAMRSHDLTELARSHGTATLLGDRRQLLTLDQAHDDAAFILRSLANLRHPDPQGPADR